MIESSATTVRLQSHSPRDTEAIGQRVGRLLERGEVIGLIGELGAGKTCMVRGIALACGVEPAEVRSPTYVLHHVYPGRRVTLHHIDCYRLGAGADLTFLDLDALIESGAVVLEWANHAQLDHYRPSTVRLGIDSETERSIDITGPLARQLLAATS